MLSIGLMSGTSMDGIDAALLETDGESIIKELGNLSIAYKAEFIILLKTAELVIRKHSGNINEAKETYYSSIKDYLIDNLNIETKHVSKKLEQLSYYLHGNNSKEITLDEVIYHSTYLHWEAIKQLLALTKYQASQIDIIGYHGQTMLHKPNKKVSIIIGDGKLLAELTRIAVVNDFRKNDIESGGQGAPFAPIYHQALAIRDKKLPLAVVNCGGIANITIINNDQIQDLIGFDTGPGNGLIDKLIKYRTCGKENMDKNGKYGSKGRVNEEVLNSLYAKSLFKDGKNYFFTPPPKSLDINDFQQVNELDSLSLEDACATLEAFTADSIVSSLDLLNLKQLPACWILAGGGWNNPVILSELKKRLKAKIGHDVKILTADQAGWNTAAMEAQIFAYFAVRSLKNKPLSVPGTTGVCKALSGGALHLPSSGASKNVQDMLARYANNIT